MRLANVVAAVLPCAVLACLPGDFARARAGMITYAVHMDTTPYAGQTGSIIFDFSNLSFNPYGASATVASFTTTGGGGLGAEAFRIGNVTGDLVSPPFSITLTSPGETNPNINQNAIQYALTFGTAFDYLLTLEGDALDHPEFATPFTMFVFDDTNTPLYNEAPNLLVSTCPICPLEPGTGVSISPVPEPGTLALTLIGLAGTSWLFRRRSRRPNPSSATVNV